MIHASFPSNSYQTQKLISKLSSYGKNERCTVISLQGQTLISLYTHIIKRLLISEN